MHMTYVLYARTEYTSTSYYFFLVFQNVQHYGGTGVHTATAARTTKAKKTENCSTRLLHEELSDFSFGILSETHYTRELFIFPRKESARKRR